MHTINKYFLFLSLICTSLLSCEKDRGTESFVTDETRDIMEYLQTNKESYSKFYEIAIHADLVEALSAYNPFGDGYTLFLPTNAAIDRYINNSDFYSTFDELLKDTEFVRILGRYHIVNSSYQTNDFPFGALSDTTATGDALTIAFSAQGDSTIYKINNQAPVIEANIELINGYVHVIDEVLKPIVFTSYEWLKLNDGFTILSNLLDVTGIKDTMGLYRTGQNRKTIKNNYTLLAEHDSTYYRNGIFSVDDLVEKYGTPGRDFTDPENGIYQFAAYHVLENSFFIDDFVSQNYNTYASSPVSLEVGLNIKINPGTDTFNIHISGNDTTYIDYNQFYLNESNILTKNGAIHLLQEVLWLYKPKRSTRVFEFLEEPLIRSLEKEPNTYEFYEPEDFEVLSWSGPEKFEYFKSASESETASNKDYIKISGSFSFNYTLPRLLPGKYKVSISTHAYSRDNAMIRVLIDGKKIGPNLDLTTGGSVFSPYYENIIGVVEFGNYEEHIVTVNSLIPGTFIWDWIKFKPE